MGDNVYLGDRNGVRTPMQWSSDRNAGFSRADPARLYFPVIMDPVYGYEAINVEAQERSPFSLLQWMKRMIALRRQHKVFGRGSIEFIRTDNRKVLTYVRRYEGEHHPLRRQPVAHGAAGRDAARRVRRADADRDARADGVPAHHRAAVLPDAGAVRLLLVPAAGGGGPADRAHGTAPRRAGRAARAVRRRRLGLDSRRQHAHHRRAAGAARIPAAAALVRRQGAAARRRALRRLGDAAHAAPTRPSSPSSTSSTATAGASATRCRWRWRAAATPTPSSSSIRQRVLARVTGARKGLLYDGLFDDGMCLTLLTAHPGRTRDSDAPRPPARLHGRCRRGCRRPRRS